MLLPILLLASLFALFAYGRAAGRWRWGWSCWPVPAALFVWMLVFLSGLQRNWDSSYYFLCELKQLISEVSGRPDTIRWVELAAGRGEGIWMIGSGAASFVLIAVLTVRSRRGKTGWLSTAGGLVLLIAASIAGLTVTDCVLRRNLLRERESAVGEMRACIAEARAKGISEKEILACLQDCREHCVVTYEHPEPGQESIRYALAAIRKLAGK